MSFPSLRYLRQLVDDADTGLEVVPDYDDIDIIDDGTDTVFVDDENGVTIQPIGEDIVQEQPIEEDILDTSTEDVCEQGPSYFCQDDDKFQMCVRSKGLDSNRETFPDCQAENKCASGPEWWCSSDEAFRDCIQSKGYKGDRASFAACKPYVPEEKQPEVPGLCRRGPRAWCATEESFKQCAKTDKSYAEYCAPYLTEKPSSVQVNVIIVYCQHCGKGIKKTMKRASNNTDQRAFKLDHKCAKAVANASKSYIKGRGNTAWIKRRDGRWEKRALVLA